MCNIFCDYTRSRCDNILHVRVCCDAKKLDLQFEHSNSRSSWDGERDRAIMTTGRRKDGSGSADNEFTR